MKRFYYHGTSADNLESILKNGLIGNTDNKLWNCSGNEVYLWDIEGVAKSNCNEDESKENKESETFRVAAESGQLALCIAKDCRVVVLKIRLDDKQVTEDYSCPNMEGRGAMVCYRDILLSEIVEISISNDLSLLKGYFMALMIENEYCGIEFDAIEEKVAKCFEKAEIYPEDIEDMIKWEKLPRPSNKMRLTA